MSPGKTHPAHAAVRRVREGAALLGASPQSRKVAACLGAVLAAAGVASWLLAGIALPAAIGFAIVAAAAAGAFSMLVVAHGGEANDRARRELASGLDRQVRSGRRLAIIDPRTGLLQHWYFEMRVAEEGARCARYGTKMALLVIDLPEEAGHDEPFLTRKESVLADFVSKHMRSVDFAARLDPGRFGVCLPHASDEGSRGAANRLMSQFDAPESVRISLAVCPDAGLELDQLLSAAADIDSRPPAAAEPAPAAIDLASRLRHETAGEIAIEEGETVKSARSKLRKAAKQAGVHVRVWEANGAIRFERVPSSKPEREVA